jgi:hypothetical protein
MEKITHITADNNNDWTCLCGNTPNDHGFYPCNLEEEKERIEKDVQDRIDQLPTSHQ